MPRKDQEREDRIAYEIVVDCYNELEVAMGWYYYLEENLGFPFDARSTGKSRKNPLQSGQPVRVIGMADVEDCEHEMWVTIQTQDGCDYDIALEQLEPLDTSARTHEAIDDWKYWLGQGYRFI